MENTLVDIAKELSERWHRGHKRRSGDSDYVEHSRRVAKKLSEHGYGDTVTQCIAHLHDTIEMTEDIELVRELYHYKGDDDYSARLRDAIAFNERLALWRMGIVYATFGSEIGDGLFVLSENMGDVGEAGAVKTDAYKERLVNSPDFVQRVKVVDFLDNSTDMGVYGFFSRLDRIREGDGFYIPMARRVGPLKLAEELELVIGNARDEFVDL